MKHCNFSIPILLVAVVLVSGCTTEQTINKFKFSDSNLDFISVNWNLDTHGIQPYLSYSCGNYKNGKEAELNYAPELFFRINNVSENASIFFNCFADVDSKRWYPIHKIQQINQDYLGLSFLNTSNYDQNGSLNSGYVMRIDFTKDHNITLCCGDVCNTKILEAYCK